jgi:hypothetical protein
MQVFTDKEVKLCIFKHQVQQGLCLFIGGLQLKQEFCLLAGALNVWQLDLSELQVNK